MSWLGVADTSERRFSLRGVGHDRQETRRHPDTDGYLLTRGSLMFETRMSPDRRPQVLLGFDQGWPDQCSLTFQAIPGGGISMVQVTGEHIAHAAVQHAVSARTDVLRITFSWDASRNWAQLTVERPEEHHISTRPVRDVRPVPLAALRSLLLGKSGSSFDGDIVFAALSDTVEPIGPAPSLSPEAMVATPDGFKPAGSLTRGDTVIARGGDVVPVLHRVSRIVPARGSFAPVRLRSPYFGLRADVIVAPEQRLVIDGSEVEYLFNEEAVLVPARHLINGFAGLKEPSGPTADYCQLILPAHEALIVAGCAVESLYIGRLRRKPEMLAQTLLRGIDRNTLPEHGRAAFKELKWFDAIHLARQRVA